MHPVHRPASQGTFCGRNCKPGATMIRTRQPSPRRPVESQHVEAPITPSLHIMSWDVAIVRISGDFRPLAEVEPGDYLPLGGLERVRAAISDAFPSAEWFTRTL